MNSFHWMLIAWAVSFILGFIGGFVSRTIEDNNGKDKKK